MKPPPPPPPPRPLLSVPLPPGPPLSRAPSPPPESLPPVPPAPTAEVVAPPPPVVPVPVGVPCSPAGPPPAPPMPSSLQPAAPPPPPPATIARSLSATPVGRTSELPPPPPPCQLAGVEAGAAGVASVEPAEASLGDGVAAVAADHDVDRLARSHREGGGDVSAETSEVVAAVDGVVAARRAVHVELDAGDARRDDPGLAGAGVAEALGGRGARRWRARRPPRPRPQRCCCRRARNSPGCSSSACVRLASGPTRGNTVSLKLAIRPSRAPHPQARRRQPRAASARSTISLMMRLSSKSFGV